jgi:hypothetical protein
MKRSFVAAVLLLVPLVLLGQEFRGTISGSVTDPSGANIAGANVTVTEVNTGTKIQTVSDSTGKYTAPYLLPGDYQVVIQAPGFKEFEHTKFHVGAGDHPVIDAKLEVGQSSQTVEVTADVPLVNIENASVGQAITTKEVEDMPLNGRTPMMLAQLAMGVVATGQPSLVHPYDSGAAAAWSVGGTYAQTSELLVDGSPNATWDGRLAYSPPQDAVQEVRVKAFDTDAGYGHTGGGTLNQVMKNGGNDLHGSMWEFTQPSNLTANQYFNNKNGLGNPLTHYNQYGLTAGGPMWIPKVYNGRNKLFWFFAWENEKDSQPNSDTASVPTAAERTGDFSQILKADSTILYNPFSATQSGSTITRQPYANNVIPTSQLNPIALAYLNYFPLPNLTNARPDGQLNYGNTSTTGDTFNNELGRLDYNMSDKNRMFFDIRRTHLEQEKNNYFGNGVTATQLFRNNWGGTLDDVYTVNATNVVDVRLNFTRMAEIHANPTDGFNPSTLGFPSYIASNSQYLQMPYITFSGSCGSQTSFQCIGGSGDSVLPSQSLQLYGTWMTIKGNHTLKFGGDARQYRLNTFTPGNASGTFSFTANSWVKASSSASSTVAWGQDFAEFLLGLPTGGSYDTSAFGSWYSYYTAGFVQDDWRVSSTLTVNLGLRYDHDGPYNEKYGRTVDGFAFNTPNPVQAQAQAAYAKNPVAQLPASAFNVLGGLTFAGPSNTAVYQNTSHLMSPRAGFAWSPSRFHGKTVFRGGFGLFVSPVTIANLAITGSYSSTPVLNQEGYAQSTTFVQTNNNYLSPANTLSNPFPAGFTPPPGSSQGLATFLGTNIAFLNPSVESPYSIRWNFGVQQELSGNLMIEAAYIGNHSVHLPVSVTQLNGIPRQYLSTSAVRDPNVNYLSNTTPNPFVGLNSALNGATVSVAQVLARYPEFPVGDAAGGWSGSGGVIEDNANLGSSYFDSFNLRVQKRMSHGVQIVGNYIFSRLTEFDSWLNDSDGRPEKRISPMDHTNRFVTALSYEIPIGRHRMVDVQNRWLDAAVGGWQINSIYTAQTGGPIVWVNGSSSTPGDYLYFGAPVTLDNRNTNSPALTTSAFDTKSADQFQYHLRTFSTTFGNLRADGINNWDLSMLKRFEVKEKMYFQLRFETFNILNHATFSAPNVQATNASFGLITAQANRPRTIQAGARFVF